MKVFYVATVVIGLLDIISLNARAAESHAVDLRNDQVAVVRGIIAAQLSAFQEDDALRAFSYAAPSIRLIFKTPKLFLQMVKKSYRALYRLQSFEFKQAKQIDNIILQPLALVDPSGLPKTVLYVMERQPDGGWLISACIYADETGKAI